MALMKCRFIQIGDPVFDDDVMAWAMGAPERISRNRVEISGDRYSVNCKIDGLGLCLFGSRSSSAGDLPPLEFLPKPLVGLDTRSHICWRRSLKRSGYQANDDQYSEQSRGESIRFDHASCTGAIAKIF